VKAGGADAVERTGLAGLVVRLRPLLADPRAHWTGIVALLRAHRALAEYEVARHYVARAVAPELEGLARSRDPNDRLRAVAMLAATYGRADAARALRRLVKDPNGRVRALARRAAHELAIADVALPDTRPRAPAIEGGNAPGAWTSDGWTFGLVGPSYPSGRRAGAKPAGSHHYGPGAGLPDLADAAALAKLAGVGDEAALRRLMRPGAGPGAPYVEFDVPKASGGARVIAAPKPALKAVQRAILREILVWVPAHEAAHGFVRGRSVLTNARPHQGAALVIKTDLCDFFPSVHYRRVVGLFELLGYAPGVATLLAGLTTHRVTLPNGAPAWPGELPQGAPTSPAIANLVCRRLDARLAGLASSAGAAYTRYADDLTFSFREPPSRGVGRFFWWVDQICQQEGFRENAAKRRVLRPSNQQRVTGVVVNSGLFVPREARRRLRAMLANCERHGLESQARGRENFREHLVGLAAYVAMVQPTLGAELLRRARALS
jgi:hypothetical protein